MKKNFSLVAAALTFPLVGIFAGCSSSNAVSPATETTSAAEADAGEDELGEQAMEEDGDDTDAGEDDDTLGAVNGPGELSAIGVEGEEEIGDDDLVASTESSHHCYCAEPYTCGHSVSTSYMYSAAHSAMEAAGVHNSQLTQTFGDAPASVGTHCPEPHRHYSAATDVRVGSHPCARVHHLRMHGFAAWYRTPPSFGYHIHAVYAGTPVLKASLRSQLASFAEGRNGLRGNAIEHHCPITAAEKRAVAITHQHR